MFERGTIIETREGAVVLLADVVAGDVVDALTLDGGDAVRVDTSTATVLH